MARRNGRGRSDASERERDDLAALFSRPTHDRNAADLHGRFHSDGGTEVGAVRVVAPFGRPELEIYVENGGDFIVPLTAVAAVHASKVILDYTKLEPKLQRAVAHVYDAEEPGK